MPELPLVQEDLDPEDNQRFLLARAQVEAVMLWPDDPDGRDRYYCACEAEALAVFSAQAIAQWPAEAIVDLLPRLASAPSRPEIVRSDDYQWRLDVGRIVGYLYNQALAASARGEPVNQREALEFYRDHRPRGRRPEKLRRPNAMGAFRPVAHLWAVHAGYHKHLQDHTVAGTTDLAMRLAESEAFLAEMRQQQWSGLGNRRLMPADADPWTVPSEIRLPSYDLSQVLGVKQKH